MSFTITLLQSAIILPPSHGQTVLVVSRGLVGTRLPHREDPEDMDSRLAVSTRSSLCPRRVLSSLPPSAVAQSSHPTVSYPPIASLSHCPMVSSPVVLLPLRPKDAPLRCPSTLWSHLTLSHPPITHVLSSRCPITSSPSHHPVPHRPILPLSCHLSPPPVPHHFSGPSSHRPIIPFSIHPVLQVPYLPNVPSSHPSTSTP